MKYLITIVEYTATITTICGALLTSLEIMPHHMYMLNTGSALWLIWAILTKQKSIALVNATMLSIYLYGILKWFEYKKQPNGIHQTMSIISVNVKQNALAMRSMVSWICLWNLWSLIKGIEHSKKFEKLFFWDLSVKGPEPLKTFSCANRSKTPQRINFWDFKNLRNYFFEI